MHSESRHTMTLTCSTVSTSLQQTSSSLPSTVISHANRVWPPTAKTARAAGQIIGVQISTSFQMLRIVARAHRVALQVRLETTVHLTFVSIAISPALPVKTKTGKIAPRALLVSPTGSLERELVLKAAQKATMLSLQTKCVRRVRHLVLLAQNNRTNVQPATRRVVFQCCLKTSANKNVMSDTLTLWVFAKNVQARVQLAEKRSTAVQFATAVKRALALASARISTLTRATLNVQLTLHLRKKKKHWFASSAPTQRASSVMTSILEFASAVFKVFSCMKVFVKAVALQVTRSIKKVTLVFSSPSMTLE